MDEQSLEPIKEVTIDFYGDEIPAALVVIDEAGRQVVYVPVRPLVEYMGLSWSGQRERIKRDAVLSAMAQGVRVTRTPEQGGSQVMLCLPLDYINGFLFGINANRVKPELRERLITYQRECYQVLAAAFLDPAAAVERLRELYRNKGYSDRWIDSRLRTISIRNELTEEWRQRGVEKDAEFAVLTAVISKGAFGVTPSEHKQLKGLKRQNLRDHMTNEELVFTMLGELATTRIARRDDAQGFAENQDAAQEGGELAGDARQKFETQTGAPVLSNRNFLEQPEAQDGLPLGKSADKLDSGEEDD
ncbi:MAG: phage antirepressor N-terminal domain-containing protein [Chloroflexi bacterium]|nr:phage antirepressor N-terminal domain-containing protein [Chloroflexota bacterium]MBP8057120.1 phage antirepressor N-terminal domain-containing protein [Chloroflexota bacterium]